MFCITRLRDETSSSEESVEREVIFICDERRRHASRIETSPRSARRRRPEASAENRHNICVRILLTSFSALHWYLVFLMGGGGGGG
ncbi:unnamed protein product [Merluccius merluccius]